jgi:hypothetical protein
MGEVVVLSLTAAVDPTLLAATTVMLLLPSPEQLMLGYWLGAMLTSVTLGLVIVFVLQDTTAAHTTKKTASPAIDRARQGLGRRHWRTYAAAGLGVIGTGLTVRGILELV